MKKFILYIWLATLFLQIGCFSFRRNDGIDDKGDLAEVSAYDKEILNRSETISDLLVELFGIDDATTIIFNDTALVALVLSQDKTFTKELEGAIIKIIKDNDSLINTVKINQSRRTFRQIEGIIADLLQGKAYDDYVLLINKIMEKMDE